MKRLFYLLFCAGLYGCSEPEPQKPADMLPQEQMVQILADIHTVESQVERAVLYPDTALMTYNHHQEEVLRKHGVETEVFRNSYNYYLRNLEQMNQLYEIVIDTLSLREIKAGKVANEAEGANPEGVVEPQPAPAAPIPDTATAQP